MISDIYKAQDKDSEQPSASAAPSSKHQLYVDMHPAIHDIGLKLIADKFQGTNQTTVAILLAIK